MKKKVLITGGPVHAHLDAVKIITNKFKGGTIAALADNLATWDDLEVTYLCAKGSATPHKTNMPWCNVVCHNGYDDYRDKVLEYAKTFDAIILGAAVANLIPVNPWKEKFPSHNYKEGDVINIPFTIAPRIINMVKQVNPRITLIGYKLLAGVSEEELIRAAKEVLVGSKADCVIANLAESLDKKIAVCKDFSTHRLKASFSAQTSFYARTDDCNDMTFDSNFIHAMIVDEHYKTMFYNGELSQVSVDAISAAKKRAREILACDMLKKWLVPNEHGFIFGTVAVRSKDCGNTFVTTTRGKKDLNTLVTVLGVDHLNREVKMHEEMATQHIKPTLNAPLLHHIFETRPDVHTIVHYHMLPKYGRPNVEPDFDCEYVLPWAPPGTVRDSIRDLASESTRAKINMDWLEIQKRDVFFIDGHGAFLMIKDGDKSVDQGNVL